MPPATIIRRSDATRLAVRINAQMGMADFMMLCLRPAAVTSVDL